MERGPHENVCFIHFSKKTKICRHKIEKKIKVAVNEVSQKDLFASALMKVLHSFFGERRRKEKRKEANDSK